MGKVPIALGMYTVYEDIKADMAGTFVKLAEMGYGAIEFYGEPEYDVDEVRRALDRSGLDLCSWHIEWRNVQPETIERTIDYLKKVGCSRAIVPCLGGKWNVAHKPSEERRVLWADYATRLNGISARLKAHGIDLGYHNHEHEFQLVYDGERVFDLLFRSLSPEIIMELDTGNAIEGGADPAGVLRTYSGRPVLLHCKPFSLDAGFDTVLGALDDRNDWKGILDAGRQDFLALIVESESRVGSGLENARACLDGLRRFL